MWLHEIFPLSNENEPFSMMADAKMTLWKRNKFREGKFSVEILENERKTSNRESENATRRVNNFLNGCENSMREEEKNLN
jgi:hypothetical protein